MSIELCKDTSAVDNASKDSCKLFTCDIDKSPSTIIFCFVSIDVCKDTSV